MNVSSTNVIDYVRDHNPVRLGLRFTWLIAAAESGVTYLYRTFQEKRNGVEFSQLDKNKLKAMGVVASILTIPVVSELGTLFLLFTAPLRVNWMGVRNEAHIPSVSLWDYKTIRWYPIFFLVDAACDFAQGTQRRYI